MKTINNWGFIKYLQIEFQNPFANWVCKYRCKKAAKRWNEDLDIINTLYIPISKKENPAFYWAQLVTQEIFMYIRLGKQVGPKEFNDLCERRGFDIDMKDYLKDMIKYVGLGKNL